MHNCMLETWASTNFMPLDVMEQLRLKTTRPYRNVCAMDAREVKVYGVIKNLPVYLVAKLNIRVLMDILVIDIPDSRGMLLLRKISHDLGGSLQMDLSYATLPSYEEKPMILHNDQFRKYHLEDPRDPMNDFFCMVDENVRKYAILSHFLSREFIEEETYEKIWTMYFDGSQSQLWNGIGIVIIPPQGNSLTFHIDYSSRLPITLLNMRPYS
jgi:hypothetical protein